MAIDKVPFNTEGGGGVVVEVSALRNGGPAAYASSSKTRGSKVYLILFFNVPCTSNFDGESNFDGLKTYFGAVIFVKRYVILPHHSSIRMKERNTMAQVHQAVHFPVVVVVVVLDVWWSL